MTATPLDFRLDERLCTGCGLCVSDCVAGILAADAEGRPRVLPGRADGCLDCQHCLAICPGGAIAIHGREPDASRPLAQAALPGFGAMDLLVRGRRSVRQYRDENVDPALIDRLLASLDHAPTGVNCRRLTCTVIQDRAVLDRFRSRVMAALTEALAAGRLSASAGYLAERLKQWLDQGQDVVFRGAPHLLLVSAPPDTPCPQQDVTLALAYFELLAQSAGLGTLWLGYLRRIFEALPDLKRLLGLPGDHVYYAMLFGYPAVRYARTVQREGVTRIRRVAALPA
jgi:nitroreductase/ferredoxin